MIGWRKTPPAASVLTWCMYLRVDAHTYVRKCVNGWIGGFIESKILLRRTLIYPPHVN